MTRPGFGLMLNNFDSMRAGMPDLRAAARHAEALELDSLWVGDHLFFHTPSVEAVVALAVAAGATDHIALGSGVLLPALREPVLLAKQVSSLMAVSGGRLVLGVGVGGEFAAEWEAVRVDVSERGARTDAVLDIVLTALSGALVDHSSRHYEVHTPAFLPAPAEPPPVWVGGRSTAALRRAVRVGDGWLSMWASPRRLTEARAELDALTAAAGRTDRVRIGALIFVSFGEEEAARGRARAFSESHYGMPSENIERWVLWGPPERVAQSLVAYVDAGVEDFILFPMENATGEAYQQVRQVYDLLRAWTSGQRQGDV